VVWTNLHFLVTSENGALIADVVNCFLKVLFLQLKQLIILFSLPSLDVLRLAMLLEFLLISFKL